jgi:hypothetical protein
MKWLLILIIGIHGAIHLMGFAKAFNLAELSQLTQPISRVSGILWLLTAVLFFASIALLILSKNYWWILAAVAILLSQVLIAQSWADARYGTILNLIILIPVIISALTALPTSYINTYKREVQQGLTRYHDMPLLTDNDIKRLPKPVQKYLYYVGAVGKPQVFNVRAVFAGQMKRDIRSNWVNIHSEQYNFFDEPTRLFYIYSDIFGIPFDGLHAYIGASATMQIKVANIFQVVDAKGKMMNKGETVTMFNDMCLLAPASLIDPHIEWETIDPLTVKARFTNKENTITTLLYFNEKGELINFSSDDRYFSLDGKTYLNYRWSTPVKGYKEYNGRKIPSYGEAIWDTPEGQFVYIKLDIVEVEYNLRAYR